MKYLSHYKEEAQTDLLNQTGAFFAFSQEQFDEQKVAGTKYVALSFGLIAPKDKVDELLDGLKKIHDQAIQQDIRENGKEAIIKRELNNYECYYTFDLTDAINALKDYGYTKEEIERVFYHN